MYRALSWEFHEVTGKSEKITVLSALADREIPIPQTKMTASANKVQKANFASSILTWLEKE